MAWIHSTGIPPPYPFSPVTWQGGSRRAAVARRPVESPRGTPWIAEVFTDGTKSSARRRRTIPRISGTRMDGGWMEHLQCGSVFLIFQVTQVQAMSRPLKPVASMSERIVSIDALRGLTILVMIFVNDLASVPNTPGWMKHAADGADGMTFVDVVFPAFLFIVGMSIPFAIGRRLELGVSRWSVWRHVLIRTLGLLVIGVYMVNTEPIMERNDLATYLWVS